MSEEKKLKPGEKGPLIKIADWGPSDVKRETKKFWIKVTPWIATAVEKSFESCPDKFLRRSVVKERTDMAKELVQELKFGFKWSSPRIRDNLTWLLRSKILGIEVDLEALTLKNRW